MGMHNAYSVNLLLLVSVFISGHFDSASAACNETESYCAAELLKNVMSAFTASNISIQDSNITYSELNQAYVNFSTKCRGISQNALRAVQILTPTLGDVTLTATQLQQQLVAQLFTRNTGYRVQYTTETPSRIAAEVLFQLQTNVSLYDAWVLDVQSTEAALRAGGVAQLDKLVAEPGAQAQLQDSDVHPFLQKYGATYGGHRTAVVLSSVIPLLYWRRDVFATFNLTSAPSTWEELLQVAAALNGTDFNGDGQPDAAICWQLDECLDSGTLLGSILASMTQYEGLSSGWLFDPASMSPLADGPPLQRALELLRNLSQLDSNGAKGCAYLHAGFLNGTCAITIKAAQQFKAAQIRYPQLRGLVGSSPLPGSAYVWNRAAQAWLSCGTDPSTSPCAYADRVVPLSLPTSRAGKPTPIVPTAAYASSAAAAPAQSTTASPPSSTPGGVLDPLVDAIATGYAISPPPPRAGGGGSGRRRWLTAGPGFPPPPPGGSPSSSNSASATPPAAAAASSSSITAAPTSTSASAATPALWVNRAPYFGMTALVGSVDSRALPDYAEAAFQFFALVAEPNTSWLLMSSDSVIGPYRRQHLDATNVPRWLAMNYSLVDLLPFLESYRTVLDHPNVALPLRLPGAAELRDVLYWSSQQVMEDPGQVPTAVAKATTDKLISVLADVGMPIAQIRSIYWDTIGYESSGAPAGGQSSWLSGRGARIGVGVAVAVTGTAVLALVAVLWHRRRRVMLRRTLFGRAMAPGASPATSLVVTDIVDSTRLWETVSPLAMTRAIQLHHETLRSLLHLHNGYESATEGDAFILSFYSAADAVAFALRAQAALLYQPWPEELFAQDPCKPEYVVCHGVTSPTERSRAALPRLARGTLYGGSPGVEEAGGGGGGAGGTAGGGSGEDIPSGSWRGASSSQVTGASGPLRLMSSALSLPLKRRPRAPNSAVGPGPAVVMPPLPGPLSRALSRQLSSTTPQLTFPQVQPAGMQSPPQLQQHQQQSSPPPAPPQPSATPPRDGFASQSLSALLLMGPTSVRNGSGATIDSASADTLVVEGASGGRAFSGGAGGPRSAQQRPGGGSRDAHTMRQLRLAMSRARNASASTVPYNRRDASTVSMSYLKHRTDVNSSVHGRNTAASARSALAGGGGRRTAAGPAQVTAPATFTDGPDISATGGGVDGAGAAGDPPKHVVPAISSTRGRVSGSGRSSDGSDRGLPRRAMNRSMSQPNERALMTQLSMVNSTIATAEYSELAGMQSAPVVQDDGDVAAGEVSAAGNLTPAPIMFNTQPVEGHVMATFGWSRESGAGHEVGHSGAEAGVSASGSTAHVGFGFGGQLQATAAAAAVGRAGPESAVVAQPQSLASGIAAAAAVMAEAAAEAEARAMEVGGITWETETGTAAPPLVYDPRVAAGVETSEGRLSAATFSGIWTAQGAGAVSALPDAPPRPSSPPRAHMSMPLPLLRPGVVPAAAADGSAPGAEEDQLLAVRGNDIESDPEPERESEGRKTMGSTAALPGADARSSRRTRGSRFARRSGLSPAVSLAGMLPAVMDSPASKVRAANPRASANGAMPANSVSGVLTASLGLMPFRRTSVPNLPALMGNSTAGGSNHESSLISPPAGGPGGSPGVTIRSMSLGAYYQQLFRPCAAGAPGAIRVAGGLSVRMGVHSGVATTQVSYNRVAGRTQYSGAALETAKVVCDAAQGGMVLLSNSAFDQLVLNRPGGASSGREPPHVMLHMGRHLIKSDQMAQELFMAQSRELLARVASLGPVRSSEQVEPGVLEAPLGEVSMAALVVVGLPTLMAWDKDATEEALAIFRQVVVTVAMRRLGGHLVEESPGRVLAVFGHPFDAIRWAAACETLLKEADWSEALLGHELAEEVQGAVLLNSNLNAPVLMGDGEMSRMLFRGLRIKGAVDCAPVKAELLPTTGRLSYRGSMVHNVQRIAAYVSTGQVVCTKRAWLGYEAAADLALEVVGASDVVGAYLGHHSIRGVGDKVELFSIRLEDAAYEASFHHGTAWGGPDQDDEGAMMLQSPPTRPRMTSDAMGGVHGGGGGGVARDLASPNGAALCGDMVGSRLGASLADTMAAQSRMWDATGEELRNMLSE